jgi:HAD superfamily hydrolase (TIGR01456 family)
VVCSRTDQQDGQPKLYFSNPDLLWAAKYHLPRLGQGGFREALEGIWAAVTGGEKNGVQLQKTVMGKPYQATYEFAEKRLLSHRRHLFSNFRGPLDHLRRVYMVGDNPASDIAGGNNYQSPHGTEWASILVQTGVYAEGTTPTHQPSQIVGDVWDAVTCEYLDTNRVWRILTLFVNTRGSETRKVDEIRASG